MELLQYLERDCIAIAPELCDLDSVLHKIAALTSSKTSRLDTDEVYQLFSDREKMGSTAIGESIAFPHCRVPKLDKFIVGILVVPQGINFDSADGHLTKIFIFVLGPDDKGPEYLHVLSSLSRSTNFPGFIESLLAQTTSNKIYQKYVECIEYGEDLVGQKGYVSFHAFIQKKELFQEILEIFNAVSDCQFIVIESHGAGEYLAKMPLYMSFGRDQPDHFHRLIIGIVPKNFVNKLLWQVRQASGDLDRQRDVLIIVQDIAFLAGALD